MAFNSKEMEELVNHVAEYIEQHLTDDLNLNDIARAADYSKFHLNRVFARYTGCTIGQYVKNRKLTEAARLLVNTDKSIIDIAFLSGYASQQSFTDAFKELYLITPYKYRKNGKFIPKQKKFAVVNSKQSETIDVADYLGSHIKSMNDSVICETYAA